MGTEHRQPHTRVERERENALCPGHAGGLPCFHGECPETEGASSLTPGALARPHGLQTRRSRASWEHAKAARQQDEEESDLKG